MRRLLPTLLLLLLAAPTRAQDGRIVFAGTEHDFGEFTEGEQVQHVFAFHNAGEAPLRLLSVQPSCGCTTPEWTREAVAPGDSGRIAVVYNSQGRPGAFQKTITVTTDGRPETVTLHIRGRADRRLLTTGAAQGHALFDTDVGAMGEVAIGRNVVHRFLMQNENRRPLRIVAARTPADHVTVQHPKQPLYWKDLVEVYVVVNTTGMTPGQRFDYEIVLETDDEAQPLKSLRVTGTAH